MHVTHSPTRFFDAVQRLKESQPHIQAIEEMGFGGLLQMPNVSLRKGMLEDIANTFQVSNGGFKLCGEIVTFHPEDVQNIMALRITGYDVQTHINTKKKNAVQTVHSEFYNRYADSKHKLELQGLEDMISETRPPDDDFKRAFVLFTIGVLLASPTGTNIHWSYIEVVRDVSKIPYFNWGQFTMKHLLHSCLTYQTKGERTLKGNLILLQVSSIWYNQDL